MPIEPCSFDPLTGFYRNGCCDTGDNDRGIHTVCVILTEEFLVFSKSVGNDLSTPMPQYDFPESHTVALVLINHFLRFLRKLRILQ